MIYAWVREGLDEQERERFDAELYAPMRGQDPDQVTPEQVAAELDAFQALSAQAKALG